MFLSPQYLGMSTSRPRRSVDRDLDDEAYQLLADGADGTFPVPGWGSGSDGGGSKSAELNPAAVAGIAVGTIVAFAVLCAVLWATVRWRRRKAQFRQARSRLRGPGGNAAAGGGLRFGGMENVYPSLAKEEGAIVAMDGMSRGSDRYETDGESVISKAIPDEVDSAYGTGFDVLKTDPMSYPQPGTPEMPSPDPNDQTPQYPSIQSGPGTGPLSPTHAPTQSPDSITQHSSAYKRFNPSPTSTAVLSRLAKIADHPQSPSTLADSRGVSPVEGAGHDEMLHGVLDGSIGVSGRSNDGRPALRSIGGNEQVDGEAGSNWTTFKA